jgi:ubiquinone/menaquinone biosynthesis C-methylase UbiE
MSIFFEIHQDNPREGPGDNASTFRAFQMIPDLPAKPNILDMGCGPGMQTLELARISHGFITALDNHQPFLDQLDRSVQKVGLKDRIEIINQSMFSLDLPENSFDLICSEGAMFIPGFQKGLEDWKKYLKPEGYLAVSELAWFKTDPPAEIKEYFALNYPPMLDIPGNLQIIKETGYQDIGHFTLPEQAWWNYFDPIAKRVVRLKEKYAGDAEALQELKAQDLEVEMYRQYHDYYGYVFFVMRKTLS